ncbi:MAG: PEP/pyruvate-binding domain-containing protein, partial [Patescibacteria group bacterium]
MNTKPFSQISKENVAEAGGKGASLGEMTQSGIAVPPGFVILSSAFEKMIEENSLRDEIDAALHAVDRDVVHTVDDASEKIRGMIESVEIPRELEEEILAEFEKLGAKFVAVRSSATSEDSADAAWAGQLETYLNTTSEDLLLHVKKCWGSLFTPRAIFYRFEQGLHGKPISVAVVVQKMVQSEKSGIAFSVHPVTQDYNQLIIEAGYGLGEAIVSGSVTPDSYVIEKDTNTIIETTVQTQSKKLVQSADGGNVWEDLSEVDGSMRVLDDGEIVELGEMIKHIENHYGFPVDVEWAFEDGKFYITQSRPITTLTPIDKPSVAQPFSVDEELFKWGPVPGYYFYLSEFLPPLYKTSKERYQAAWPKMIMIFQQDIMFCGLSQREVDETGIEVFERLLLADESYKKMYQEYEASLKDLKAVQEKIDATD